MVFAPPAAGWYGLRACPRGAPVAVVWFKKKLVKINLILILILFCYERHL
jgi:hypothetical protein